MPENLASADTDLYSATRGLSRLEGLVQVPVQADPPAPGGTQVPCEIVRLHAPVEAIVWSWEVRKFGKPPTVPSPDLIDPGKVLLSSTIGAVIPPPDVGGAGHFYSLSGTYTYAQVTPKGITAPIPLGKLPWENIAANYHDIPSSAFSTGILSEGGVAPARQGG